MGERTGAITAIRMSYVTAPLEQQQHADDVNHFQFENIATVIQSPIVGQILLGP